MDPTEIAWKWMNDDSNYYELSALVHQAIAEEWKPRQLGDELLKHFYAQIPLFGGEPAFWRDVLDQCLEKVNWTSLARRALKEAAAA